MLYFKNKAIHTNDKRAVKLAMGRVLGEMLRSNWVKTGWPGPNQRRGIGSLRGNVFFIRFALCSLHTVINVGSAVAGRNSLVGNPIPYTLNLIPSQNRCATSDIISLMFSPISSSFPGLILRIRTDSSAAKSNSSSKRLKPILRVSILAR